MFGSHARKELPVPKPINDYNHGMGGRDVANQLRAEYDVQRRNRRTWRALFYFLKTSIVNAYKLQAWGVHPPKDSAEEEDEDFLSSVNGAHRKFREASLGHCGCIKAR